MHIEELASQMDPASGFLHLPSRINRIETRIGVGLQDVGEGAQVTLRMLALAIGRVRESHGRRVIAAGGAIVAHIGPQPCGLGLSFAGREHRQRSVVGMHFVAGKHVAA